MKKIVITLILPLLFVGLTYSQGQKKRISDGEKPSEKSIVLIGKKYFSIGSDGIINISIVESTNLITNVKTNGVLLSVVDSIGESQSDSEQIELNAAKRELERVTFLLEQGETSRLEYDKAKDRFAIAESKLKNAKKKVTNIGTVTFNKSEVERLLKTFIFLKNKIWNTTTNYQEISFTIGDGLEFVSFFNEGKWVNYLKTLKNNTNSYVRLTKENVENLQKLLQDAKQKL